MRNDVQMSNCYYTWEMLFKWVTDIQVRNDIQMSNCHYTREMIFKG